MDSYRNGLQWSSLTQDMIKMQDLVNTLMNTGLRKGRVLRDQLNKHKLHMVDPATWG
jgi:hypothetical protein